MRLGKDLNGKPIISITDGRLVGHVKDIFVDSRLEGLSGIFIGQEGLLKRKILFIPRDRVALFGIDAILVENADVITDDQDKPEVAGWLRLQKLRGRDIETSGGTKVGSVGDVILEEEGYITGFALARVYVEGPIKEKGLISRRAVINTGSDAESMTVDITAAEQAQLGAAVERPPKEAAGAAPATPPAQPATLEEE